jgi:glycosyltransferase involved in cell wall biosynthesis
MTRSSRGDKAAYGREVVAFRALIERAVPPTATVAVATKGDHELLRLGERRAWHFPQRSDGVYAGYYPPDSASAVAHLEAVRDKGAEYLAFPATGLWWLTEYKDFGNHLETSYFEVARDDEIGAIFDISAAADRVRGSNGHPAPAVRPAPEASETVWETPEDGVRSLIDVGYYGEQVGREFDSAEAAAAHYLESGDEAADPHPLFDSRWYLTQNPRVAGSGETPLAHFLRLGHSENLDPSPYFDTEYYYSQRPSLRQPGRSALLDYVEQSPARVAAHPNAIFDDSYYLTTYRDAEAESATPFEHFLRLGVADGRFGSALHRNALAPAERPASSLFRGDWRRDLVLFVTSGAGSIDLAEIADRLGREYHTGTLLVSYHGASRDPLAPVIVLEDFELATDIYRPATLRLLGRSLAALDPAFAVCDVPHPVEALTSAGVRTIYVPSEDEGLPSRVEIQAAIEAADRVASLESSSPAGAAAELLETAREAFAFSPQSDRVARASNSTKSPKIVVPCSDWEVSGVNTALESLGHALIDRGWDFEILFTRREDAVLETVEATEQLPALPYRMLERRKPGALGMWEDLIAELEASAPAILFMAYDFLANGVVGALSDRVGAVGWTQADDGDYYEQTYRLGRYCNAVVCVSEQIKAGVTALNPAIGDRAHVIHNSSMREQDIAERRAPRGDVMRLVYSGRLVQYQKRVLDFIELAEALDRAGIAYEISLIGTFSAYEDTEEIFRRAARDHLEEGRIKLAGRMTRSEILDELTSRDFFVLLSDFEGFPLSLVEAMGRGCVPVVADSKSGIPEVIDSGETGLIVPGRDYDQWAKLLADLWQDDARYSSMSREARAKVRNEFTVERIGEKFDQLLRQIAEEITTGSYERPPALNWGRIGSRTGDVLAPPSMHYPDAFIRV